MGAADHTVRHVNSSMIANTIIFLNIDSKDKMITTLEGKEFFDWFLSMYESAYKNLSDLSNIDGDFKLFDVRLNNTLASSIDLDPKFRHAQIKFHREAYVMMLKLSNIWFCYEALVHAFKSEGLLENPRSKVNPLGDDMLEVIDKSYDIFEVRLDFWGMNGDIVRDEKYRTDMQGYMDHLISSATSKEQKQYLPEVFNLFTNNDMFSTPQALSFAYAIRNQYVHAGESPMSGVQYIETKIAALKSSYDFLVLFCLRAGECFIDKKIQKISDSDK